MQKTFPLILLSLALVGCETLMDLNPLDRPPDPLKGTRTEVPIGTVNVDKTLPQPFNPSAPIPAPAPPAPQPKGR